MGDEGLMGSAVLDMRHRLLLEHLVGLPSQNQTSTQDHDAFRNEATCCFQRHVLAPAQWRGSVQYFICEKYYIDVP